MGSGMTKNGRAAGNGKRDLLGMYGLLVPTAFWLVLFIIIPFTIMLVYSFWIVREDAIVKIFSFRNYVKFFTEPVYLALLWRTFLIAFGVTVTTFVFGYPLALYINRKSGRVKSILYMLIIIPLLTSYIIRIYAMRLVLGTNGVINNLLMFMGIIREPLSIFLFNRFAIFLTFCVTLSPFMVMPIFTALEKIPSSYIEASHDLGASKLQTFWKIIFPISLPGFIAGGMFIFILALGDFLTPVLVGGNQGMTMGKAIQLNFGIGNNWPYGSTMSIVLLLLALIIIMFSSRLGALKEL
jgi:spermidine/putrescine transport system permease protein